MPYPDGLKINLRDRKVYRGEEFVRLSGIEFKIFLIYYFRGEVENDEMYDILWGWDINGGPNHINNCLHVNIGHANHKLAALNVHIGAYRNGFKALKNQRSPFLGHRDHKRGKIRRTA